MNPKIIKNTSLPSSDTLVNVLLVTTDASFCSCQVWSGTSSAVRFILEKIARSEDPTDSWNKPLFQVMAYFPSHNETYIFSPEEFKAIYQGGAS